MKTSSVSDLPPEAFAKADPSPDPDFYALPRLVTHIDNAAIAALTDFYRQTLPAGGAVLDLMSSWVSHYPPEVGFKEVIGHGLNADELRANPRLDRWWVQDLNTEPVLPLPKGELDAATICVSVQYLQRPIEVLASLRRAMRPGSPVVISFSNRCFPSKAVAIWGALDEAGHAGLVRHYLDRAGWSEIVAYRLADGRTGDPLVAVVGRA